MASPPSPPSTRSVRVAESALDANNAASVRTDAASGSTDQALVSRLRAKDTAAFEQLMRRYNQRLYRLARSILRNEGEAEDVVQQAYLSAFAHLDEFRGDARFGTWLTRIAI